MEATITKLQTHKLAVKLRTAADMLDMDYDTILQLTKQGKIRTKRLTGANGPLCAGQRPADIPRLSTLHRLRGTPRITKLCQ